MRNYVLRRLLVAIPSLLIASLIVFTLPRLIPGDVVQLMLQEKAYGTVIPAESALSFLGFGVPPPYPSWGAMLSGSGRSYMYHAPWMALFPSAAIFVAVFGFNMLGDALRDVLDPPARIGPVILVAPAGAPYRRE